MTVSESNIVAWTEALSELRREAGKAEETQIVTNLLVIDAAPAGLTGYIQVTNEQGFKALALKLPSMAYAVNDYVNVLYKKGTEAVAISQGSASPSVAVKVFEIWESDFGGRAGAADATGNFVWNNWAVDARERVKNTSGATAAASDVGYIDSAGEFKTTTTANLDAAWCVVLQGAANGSDIYVTTRGRVTVAYTGTAPAVGEYLTTSTSAGDALATATMRPEIFAVCLAAGSGGFVSALLLTQRKTIPLSSTNDVIRIDGMSDSNFVATIDSLPGGAVVRYDTPSVGVEANIVPQSATQLAKIRLYNSTRGTYALIDSVNTTGGGGYDGEITLTAAVPVGWAAGDTITAQSQTNAGTLGGVYYDIEFTSSEVPALTTMIGARLILRDTVAATAAVGVHPWEANATSKIQAQLSSPAGVNPESQIELAIIAKRFTMAVDASGVATARPIMRINKVTVAAP